MKRLFNPRNLGLSTFLLILGCNWKTSTTCDDIKTCDNGSDSGTHGSGGGSSSGGTGAGTGGATSACSVACTGATPVCNSVTKACVKCTSDTHCSGADPACNTTTNLCVECTKDSQCSGNTPVCNTSTDLCVQCTKDSQCSGSTPFCNTAANVCVQCKSNADCTSATASLCSNGTCSPCSRDADCSLISGKTVCKLAAGSSSDAGTSGVCVQCTGTDYAACGQNNGKNLVCNSLTNMCSTNAEQSAGLCQTCVSDAQCATSEMCVNEAFNGSSVGYFCFYKQGATGAPSDCFSTGRPYVKTITKATSIDGQMADICSLRSSTCTALNQFSSKDCASVGTASDALCGFSAGVDSKCAAASSSQFRCTVTCGSTDDCPLGVNFTCNTGANPPVCTLQ